MMGWERAHRVEVEIDRWIARAVIVVFALAVVAIIAGVGAITGAWELT